MASTLKIIFLLLLSTATIPTLSADIREVQAEARVTAATIYRTGGADIEMTLTATVDQGTTRLLLPGLLPANVDTTKLSITGEDGDISVLSRNIQQVNEPKTPSQAVTALKEQIAQLTAKIREAKDSASAANVQIDLLASSKNEELTGLEKKLDLMSSKLPTLYENYRTHQAVLEESTTAKARLEKDLTALLVKERNRYTVMLDIFAETGGEKTLSLRYNTDSARWSPMLDVRLDSQKQQITFDLRAQITQQTGVDWQDIPVALQVERGQGFLSPPGLTSRYLDLSNYPRPRQDDDEDVVELEEIIVTSSRRSREDRVERKPKPEFDYSESLYEERPQGPTLETEGRRQTFELSGINLTSGSDQQTLLVYSHTQPTKFKTIAYPSEEGYHAVLAALTDYSGMIAFTDIPTKRMLDGTPLGPVDWPDIQPGNQVELAITQQPEIIVTDRPFDYSSSEKGFFRSKKRQTTRRIYRVENRGLMEATVEIRARLPVSVNEDLVIDALETNTPFDLTKVRDERGVIGWIRTLKQGENVEIDFGYSVTYPKDLFLFYR